MSRKVRAECSHSSDHGATVNGKAKLDEGLT